MKRFTWTGISVCTPEETARIVFLNKQLTGQWFCRMETNHEKLTLYFIQQDDGTYPGTLYCRHADDWQQHPPTLHKRTEYPDHTDIRIYYT